MIGRTISQTMLDAAAATPSRLLVFVEINWPSGWVRFHSGLGEREISGRKFYGVGEFISMGNVKENALSSANRLPISMSLPDPSLLANALNDDPIGREAFVHLAALDEHRRIIDTYEYFVDGDFVDYTIIRGDLEKGIKPSLNGVISDFLERWSTAPNPVRTTDAAQQHMHPGDNFFSMTEIISGSSLDSLPFKSGPVQARPGGTIGDEGFDRIK